MVKKNYVIIQEINKELEKHRNFIGYIDGRLNAFDGDLLVMETRFEKTKAEYNTNTKDLQNARTETLNKIKILNSKLKNVGKKPIPEPKPLPIKKKIIEKVKEIVKPKPEPLIEESPKTPLDEAKFTKKQINLVSEELQEAIDDLDPENAGKVQCHVCKKYYTKGGAFIAHYKSHFKNGNGTG